MIGYLGVRVFCPRPVAAMLDNVGGCSVLLGESESLYIADICFLYIFFSYYTLHDEGKLLRLYMV